MNSKKEAIHNTLVSQIVDGEYRISMANQQSENDEYESFIALLDAERGEKQYDWMSDIRIPEFASHVLTQTSIDVGQYFQTRDFVEVYLEDEGDQAKKNSASARECINRTLNQKHLYHYPKFVRAKVINNLVGKVYLKCWWEQSTHEDVVGYAERVEELDVDVNGNPLMFSDQIPAQRVVEEPVMGEIVDIDRFNYDIWDQRNVFTDNSYVYSLQQKKWVIFRSAMTETEIKENARSNGYFNLDKLKDLKPPQ
jgi:hypothetical protein